jgi:hypothetical protein
VLRESSVMSCIFAQNQTHHKKYYHPMKNEQKKEERSFRRNGIFLEILFWNETFARLPVSNKKQQSIFSVVKI